MRLDRLAGVRANRRLLAAWPSNAPRPGFSYAVGASVQGGSGLR